jgi:hypothetical protein
VSEPEVRREGDKWTLHWPDEPYAVSFDQLREHSDELYAEFSALASPAPAGKLGLIHRAKLNLSSTMTRERLAKFLTERTKQKNGFWATALEQACWIVTDAFRLGEPFLDLADGQPCLEVKYLVYPILPDGQITALFADGDSGKGWIALAIALSLRLGQSLIPGLEPKGTCNTLYLDWETCYEENQRRLAMLSRGLGIERPRGIIYRKMNRRLADDIGVIKQWASRCQAGLVVIDSAGPATGGELKDSDPVNGFMGAVRGLTPSSVLILGHVSKETAKLKNGERGRMFGSVFYENLSRSCWEMRSNTEDNPIRCGLFHRKANLGTKHKPIGLAARFDDREHSVIYHRHDISETPDIAEHATAEQRIRWELRRGMVGTPELSERLGIPEATIRKTCGRMPDVKNFGGTGKGARDAGLWGLLQEEV